MVFVISAYVACCKFNQCFRSPSFFFKWNDSYSNNMYAKLDKTDKRYNYAHTLTPLLCLVRWDTHTSYEKLFKCYKKTNTTQSIFNKIRKKRILKKWIFCINVMLYNQAYVYVFFFFLHISILVLFAEDIVYLLDDAKAERQTDRRTDR